MGGGPYRLVASPGPGGAPRRPWLTWTAVLSGKEARRTRIAAGLAIVLLVVVVVLSIVSVNDDLRRLSVQIPLLLLAVAGAWYAVTRTGARRVAGAAVVAVAVIGAVGYGFVQDPSTFAVALGRLALLVLAVLLGRWAVRRTWAAAEPPGPSTAPVDGTAAHGPGAHGRPHGSSRADHQPPLRRREGRAGAPRGGVRGPGHRPDRPPSRVTICRSWRAAPSTAAAPVIGMAGGDGSQALVATVAAERQVPMVVVPAGTRNHLARDLGLDRDDVVGALDRLRGRRGAAHGPGDGRRPGLRQQRLPRALRVDRQLARVPRREGRHRAEHAAQAAGPRLEALRPPVHGTGRSPPRSGPPRPDLQQPLRRAGATSGADRGWTPVELAVITLEIDGDRSAAAFLAAVAGGRPDRFSGFSSWTATTFEVDSGGPVDAGLDGESLTLPRPAPVHDPPSGAPAPLAAGGRRRTRSLERAAGHAQGRGPGRRWPSGRPLTSRTRRR